MPTADTLEKRKKGRLAKGGASNSHSNSDPDISKDTGKDSPNPSPKAEPTPAVPAPSSVSNDIPQSMPTDAAGVVSDIGNDSPVSIPQPAAAVASDVGKDIPLSVPKPAAAAASDIDREVPTSLPKSGLSPTPAAAAPPVVTTTVISTSTVFSSISTATVHVTDSMTLTKSGTGSSARAASTSGSPGPVRAGESLSGAALTDAILAQCPKTTSTVTKTVSVASTPLTTLVDQKAISSASPMTRTITSVVVSQADRAPTCSALPVHREHTGPAEIAAIVLGLITLMLLIAVCFLARKCYRMHRAERIWGKRVRNQEIEMKETSAEGGSAGAGMVANRNDVHPARAGLGQRLIHKLAKLFERKEAWERR